MAGVESLSKHLNDYFGAIVTRIMAHGGDVIKFAGILHFAQSQFVVTYCSKFLLYFSFCCLFMCF